MKRLLIALLLLLFAVPARTEESFQLAWMSAAVVGSGSAAVANFCAAHTSEALCEDFDGITSCADTYTTTCEKTWTVTSGTPDFDNAASPAPLDGTHSISLANAAVSISTTSYSEAYLAAKVNWDTNPSGTDNVLIMYQDNTEFACYIVIMTDSKIRVYDHNGVHSSASASALTPGTSYYLKIYGKKGTGADQICRGYYSTDGSNWTQLGSGITNGSGANDIASIKLQEVNKGITVKMDDVIYSNSDINY